MDEQTQCWIDEDGRVACASARRPSPAPHVPPAPALWLGRVRTPDLTYGNPALEQARRSQNPPPGAQHVGAKMSGTFDCTIAAPGQVQCEFNEPSYAGNPSPTTFAPFPGGQTPATQGATAMQNPQAQIQAQQQATYVPPATGPGQGQVQVPEQVVCFNVKTGTIIGGRYDGAQPPQGSWVLSTDKKTVTLDIGGDNVATIPVCPSEAKLCCIHVLTDDAAGISAQTPAAGRIDCPSNSELHGMDVDVVAVQPDGEGGLSAMWTPKAVQARVVQNAATGNVLPVCSIGKQDQDPIPCCIYDVAGQGRLVKCDDEGHPMHGQPAQHALAAGYTLEVCPPPPEIPPCCVELGSFSEGGSAFNGRIVCEDSSHALHGALVQATPLGDGMYASVTFSLGDHQATVKLRVCEEEDVPEEIPCCLRDGRLYCPDNPEYHGMAYSRFTEVTGKDLSNCPEKPPEIPPPGDCCVQLGEDAGDLPVLVCSDPNNPWHGYELKESEFICHVEQGFCEVRLQPPGESALAHFKFPICPPPPPEQLPPDCCFDVAAGTLLCPSDPDSEWHGLRVSLEQMVPSEGGPTWALVSHRKLGPDPARFPVCDRPAPPDCCFQSSAPELGAAGKVICQSAHEWNDLDAVLVDVTPVNGAIIGTIAWPGSGARMPLCAPPPEKPPGCPPQFFCCVNLDTGTYVCAANVELNGQPADVASQETINGMPFVRLADGALLPACGSQCPAPECPRPGLIPTGDPECGPPPEIPQGTPNKPPGTVPTPPQECGPVGPVPQGGPGVQPGTIPTMPAGGGMCPPGGPVPQGGPGVQPGTIPMGGPGGANCPPGGPVPQGGPGVQPGTIPMGGPGGANCPPGGPVPQGGPGVTPGVIPTGPTCP